MNGETVTFTIESAGDSTELELPAALVDLIGTEEDAPTDVVADVAMMACTQQMYEAVRSSEGAVGEDVRDIEADTRALFEEQFGTSFEDLSGYAAREDGHGHGRD
ncbi:DUF7545 family protein [Halorussus halophilus]|uniref:DUF7545 family protein n=1 Tax=Halorussus halophilus TaxID=2650975 RepID=UPI001301064F|nr:hypothetical protein [Halorussus halophilus]